MSRFTADKKLYALDAEFDALAQQRRALEIQALGAEVAEAERRDRYFSIADIALRRRLIGVERALYDLRQRRHAAAVEYWTTVTTETRARLDDLQSSSPTSGWRRRMWWDLLTIFWILAGAGWLAFDIAGAAGGAVATAVWGWFIVRSREEARVASIRQGEDLLRSSESELQQVRQDGAGASPPREVFSAVEEETGTPGDATRSG